MRITGGKARSIAIHCPKGDRVRPATDRMRESLFASLGEWVVGGRFLDLFAGTGSYGLEAVSRGAQSGCFVERDRQALVSLRRNLDAVLKSVGGQPSKERFVVYGQEVERWVHSQAENTSLAWFDVVFMDPPYSLETEKVLQLLLDIRCLLPSGKCRIVVETAEAFEADLPGFSILRTFGKGRVDSRCTLLSWDG